ncbi:MAG: MerR family transcriptional regulator [Clostridium sp.]|nr:MerR family transcriptional regulator [Clostridium sp.]
MKTYKTSEVAQIIGIHPNTVRLYEEWGFIPKPERQENGYRVFTDLHILQIGLARAAFQIEFVQGGLRKKIVEMVKISAKGDFDGAMILTKEYLQQLGRERDNAEEAIQIVTEILSGAEEGNMVSMRRKEASQHLGVSMDALRNWEMNGLLTVKRKKNGYRVYTDGDIRRLKIIRSLRRANYSLEAILRLLQQIAENPHADVKAVLNTPKETDEIISVCDRQIVSLQEAEKNAYKILDMLQEMKNRFS